MQKGVVRKRRTPPLSEYGRQLQEKQELKGQYNLRERQFKQYVVQTLGKGAGLNAAELLMQQLEKRLDSTVYRMGVAATRKQAKQMVSHGHFLVNGRSVNIPSYMVRREDVISLKPQHAQKTIFQNAKLTLKKYTAPTWLQLDKEKIEAKVLGVPSFDEVAPTVEIPLIFEFYSR
ncbi:MAG TPA: 30S ribosomal protein S4 [Candidatus Paceibacterota bacterium]